MRTLLFVVLTCVMLNGCAAPKTVKCPVPRDIAKDESLKHYTIHVLNLYNMCRDAQAGKRDMPASDTLADGVND